MAAAAVLVLSVFCGTGFAAAEGELLMEEEATESLEEGGSPAETVTGNREYTLTDTAFDSIVLIDTDEAGMYAESDDTDMSDGYTWQLHIENRTDDYLAVTLADAAVNSFMCASDAWGSSSWALSADSDMDTEVTWSREALDAIGAQDILEIMFPCGPIPPMKKAEIHIWLRQTFMFPMIWTDQEAICSRMILPVKT